MNTTQLDKEITDFVEEHSSTKIFEYNKELLTNELEYYNADALIRGLYLFWKQTEFEGKTLSNVFIDDLQSHYQALLRRK